jgi:hypothetical protein
LQKIEKKHSEENFTLSTPEYEEILDALVGAHYTMVPEHLQPEGYRSWGEMLMQARTAIQMLGTLIQVF